MGVLCKNPQSSVSGLLVSDVAAASLLSLAAQMALEVNARLGLTEALALEDCGQVDTFLHIVFVNKLNKKCDKFFMRLMKN